MEYWNNGPQTEGKESIFHYSTAQAHGPTSAVSETEERTSIVPASTGVGAAAAASICVTRGWGHNDRPNSAFTFGNGEDLDDFEAEGIGHFLGFSLALIDARRRAWSWALCSSLRVKSSR